MELEQDSLEEVLVDDSSDKGNEEDSSTKEDEHIVKGEDIYVENDINDLNRMLGVSSDEDDADEDIEESEDIVDEDSSEIDDVPSLEVGTSEGVEYQDDAITEKEDSEDTFDEYDQNDEDHGDEDQDDKPSAYVLAAQNTSVMISDFMDVDTSTFSYLEKGVSNDYYINSIPLNDKKTIQRVVRKPTYLFRYPKFILRDYILGHKEHKFYSHISYTVYFPEYSLYFRVPVEYAKPFAVTMDAYIEDLVSRIRPSDMAINYYDREVVITSLKVLETGLLEVTESSGEVSKYLLVKDAISFWNVLDYIRSMSDKTEGALTLKLLPRFFVKI